MSSNHDTLITRIMEMEERYHEVVSVLDELKAAIEKYNDFKSELDSLKEYMESGQWQKDYEADEAGQVPADLKREVLSQDALYDLLEDADKMLAFEVKDQSANPGGLMFKVSDIITTPPPEFSTHLQELVYNTFASQSIPFERVDTDPGITMEDCRHIDAKIGVRIVKTVFLCNRQQTAFWLYVTTDDKPFVTREFCAALGGIPRVSFAPAEKLRELTGVEVGATTILSAVLSECGPVRLVMDRSIAESEWFACTDGTATCFVKIRTRDLLAKYIPATGHDLTII